MPPMDGSIASVGGALILCGTAFCGTGGCRPHQGASSATTCGEFRAGSMSTTVRLASASCLARGRVCHEVRHEIHTIVAVIEHVQVNNSTEWQARPRRGHAGSA